jgi:hypothetical protein
MNKQCRIVAILIMIISIGLTGCSTEKRNIASTESSPKPDLDLQGRLLWSAFGGVSNSLTIYEFNLATMSEKILVDWIPKIASNNHMKPREVFSKDGDYILVISDMPENVVIINTENADITPLPLPDIDNLGYFGIRGAFSPNNSVLAYALTGYDGLTKSGLYLFNIETGKTTTLYEAPCSLYMMQGEVCGAVLDPEWIDETTLITNGYKGEMPDKIKSQVGPYDPVGSPIIPPPNRTLVIDVNGRIFQEYDPILGDYLEVLGKTLHVTTYTQETTDCEEECQELEDFSASWKCIHNCLVKYEWFSTDSVIEGKVRSTPFTISSYNIPSPDGNFILNHTDDGWNLIRLSDGTALIVENLSQTCDDDIITWSPDGEFIICHNSDTEHWLVFSMGDFTHVDLPNFDTNSLIWVP